MLGVSHMSIKLFARIAAGVLGVGALLMATASPASAHVVVVEKYVGGQVAGRGKVSEQRVHVATCDTRSDGRGVRTDFRRAGGQTGHVTDANGANPGCTNRPVASNSNPVTRMRVCVGSSCTQWIPV